MPGPNAPIPKRTTRRWAQPSVLVPGLILFVAIGALALVTVPGWLLGNWFPEATDVERNKLLGVAAQIVLFALGGVIAIIGVAVSLSRHGQELVASERDQARLDHDKDVEEARREEVLEQRRIDAEIDLRARFVGSVGLLSEEAPIRRQAGLISLAALADAWITFGRSDEAQVCIDVITTYLASPSDQKVRVTPASERTVRLTGYALISAHLNRRAEPSWRDKTVKVAGAVIDFPVEMSGLALKDEGSLHFSDLLLRGAGMLRLGEVELESGAQMSIMDAVIDEGASLRLGGLAITEGSSLMIHSSRIGPGARLQIISPVVTARGHAILAGVSIEDSGALEVLSPEIHAGGIVTVSDLEVSRGSVLNLTHATIGPMGEARLHNVALPGDMAQTFARRVEVDSQATIRGAVTEL